MTKNTRNKEVKKLRSQENPFVFLYILISLNLHIFISIFSLTLGMGLTCFAQPRVLDGVVAVVGNSPILKSEVESKQIQAKLDSVKFDRCNAIEDLLYQKLLLAQAIRDSVEITDEQVEDELDRRLRYYISQFGSVKAFEDFYGKSMEKFKEEFREELREVLLVQRMQQRIAGNISISPAEVRAFFESIPKDSIPFINAEVEVGHIVKVAKIHPELKKYARDKLESIRQDIVSGKKDFSSSAILNSMDPGSSANGGLYKNVQRGTFVPEFDAVAFRMKPNDSPILFEMTSSRSDAANPLALKGRITTDEEKKSPLANLFLELLDKNGLSLQSTATDSSGFFTFEKLLPEQKYFIRISKNLLPVSRSSKLVLSDESGKIISSVNPKDIYVSEVFETDFGYHILTVESRRGDEVDVRHILIVPQPSSEDLMRARTFLDSIAGLIRKDTISLTEAASRFSDDEETKLNGGLITNPYTGSPRFEVSELSQIDPNLVFTIDKMKAGEVSAPVPTQSRNGKPAYHIIFVKNRTEPHRANLKDDYQRIQDEALAEKKNKTVKDWVKKKTAITYIRISDEYKNCSFDNQWIQ